MRSFFADQDKRKDEAWELCVERRFSIHGWEKVSFLLLQK